MAMAVLTVVASMALKRRSFCLPDETAVSSGHVLLRGLIYFLRWMMYGYV